MPRLLAAWALSVSMVASAAAQQTVAESSDWTKTSSHEEVESFLRELKAKGAPLELRELGRTEQGRPITLGIFSDPRISSPEEVDREKKLVVYVQGNIHGGEVAGKEGLLALLRDLSVGSQGELGRAVLARMVVLAVPDYNPDGNDDFGEVARHRPGQVGPEHVGRRPNGQGLDLNRDYMKAESPEMGAVLEKVLLPWDPDLLIDLHTTNGSHHALHLTYAPSLHPLPDWTPTNFLRRELLPEVRARLGNDHAIPIFDYGNFRRGQDPPQWWTYEPNPRFGTNYMALRGRSSILSEAYSHASYRERVEASYWFVAEILRYLAAHAVELREIHRAIDRRTVTWGERPHEAPALGVAFEHARRETDAVLPAEILEPPEPGSRRRRGRPTGRYVLRRTQIYDRFQPTREVAFPAGFLLPPEFADAVAHVRRHGIRVETLERGWSGEVEVFTPRKVNQRNRPFQGHRLTTLEGQRLLEHRTLPPGSFHVSTAQRLGVLAFYLLDPEATDGMITWEKMGFAPKADEALRYYRVMRPVR